MKSISRLLTVFAILAMVSVVSCKKGDTGPAGPAGPQGPQGTQGTVGLAGKDGNANVMEYFFLPAEGDSIDFAPNSGIYVNFQLPNDTLTLSAWFMYMYKFPLWYAIPGHGAGNATSYSFSYGYLDFATPVDSAYFFIDKVSGPGEAYDAIKLVRILTNDLQTDGTGRSSGNRRGLPNIDFSNYEEVKKYYHLK